MNFLEFYRSETYHPVTVHWPIVLLTIGSLFYIIGYFKNNYLLPAGKVLIYIGTTGAWISIYTGNLADGIVSRELCDPTILKTHENFAYYTAYIFSMIVVSNLLLHFFKLKKKLNNMIHWLLMIFMVAGIAILVYASHLGGSLVYDQAAGVTVPSSDCREFE